MRTLQTSQYLRTLRSSHDSDFTQFGGRIDAARSEPTIVFHSLFGRGRWVGAETVQLLQNCKAGVAEESLRALIGPDDLNALLELSYLVPAGFDEQLLIDDLLVARERRLPTGELITSLQLILTNGCNFKCEYCFAYNFDGAVTARNSAGESVTPGPMIRRSPELSPPASPQPDWNVDDSGIRRNPRGSMTTEIAVAAIQHAILNRVAHGGGRLGISFFGGEPTLNRQVILEVLERFGDGSAWAVALEWDLTTNGSRIDDELAAAFARHRVNTAVSIDYICDETGGYRGAAKPTTSWPVVRENTIRLIRAGVPVSITSVLSAQTWSSWNHRLIDWCADIGVRELNVIVSFQADFFRRFAPVTVAEKLLEAFDHGQRRGVLLTGYWYHTYLLIVDEVKWARQADYKTCPAIGRMLSIEPNGAVFSCKATNTQMGHIDDWAGIFSSPAYREYGMRAYTNGPECRGCELQGTCSGGSAGQLEEAHHSIARMNAGYCEYIRAVVHGLLEREAGGRARNDSRRMPSM